MHCATEGKEPALETGRASDFLEMKQPFLPKLVSSLLRLTCHIEEGKGGSPGVSRSCRQGCNEICRKAHCLLLLSHCCEKAGFQLCRVGWTGSADGAHVGVALAKLPC